MGRTLQIVAAGAQPVVIFDENKPRPTDFCRDGFLPKPARQWQVANLVRGAAPFIADRFNQYCIWDFDVLHAFSNAETCQDFVGNRPGLVRSGKILFLTSYSGQRWQRSYALGYLAKIEPVKQHPLSCDFHYTLWLPTLYSVT